MSAETVLIIGGGRGIGRATAQRFAAGGAQIMVAARSNHELDETRRLIVGSGGLCEVSCTDACSCDEVDALIETTVKRFGRVDVLVNCAGIAPNAKLEELDPAIFRTIFAVNAEAVYFACRAAWPVMKRRRSGVIVNVSSVASVDPFPGFAAYGAAKAWVNLWTKALAEEGRSLGIRVFAVAPGAVETRMLRDNFPDFPADLCLQPGDVANVIHAVAGTDCRYATGQTVFVRK